MRYQLKTILVGSTLDPHSFNREIILTINYILTKNIHFT